MSQEDIKVKKAQSSTLISMALPRITMVCFDRCMEIGNQAHPVITSKEKNCVKSCVKQYSQSNAILFKHMLGIEDQIKKVQDDEIIQLAEEGKNEIMVLKEKNYEEEKKRVGFVRL